MVPRGARATATRATATGTSGRRSGRANWRSGIVFPGVQKTTWTYDRKAREYYFHRFYDFQPDLNMDNPRVREEVRRIMGFWLQLGVSGFRMDAVPFVIEKPPRRRAQAADPLRVPAGDPRASCSGASATPSCSARRTCRRGESQPYFGGRRRAAHDVQLLGQPAPLARARDRRRAAARARRCAHTQKLPPTAQWAHFLRNHDELDLGRLDRRSSASSVFEAFGPEPTMQLYGRGIRRRLAPMLGDRRRLELAYSLVLLAARARRCSATATRSAWARTCGCKERARDPHADAVVGRAERRLLDRASSSSARRSRAGRTATSASTSRSSGATRHSLLHWTERMIRLRKECPEIGWGDVAASCRRASRPCSRSVRLARQHDRLRPQPRRRAARGEAASSARGDAGEPASTSEEIASRSRRRARIVLESYGYRWFRARRRLSQALARHVVG